MLESLGLLLLVLTGFFSLGASAQLLNLGWGLWFSEIFVFAGIPSVALALRGSPKVPLQGLTWPVALYGFAVGAVNYLAWAVPLMSLAEALFPKVIVDLFDGSAIFKNQTPVEVGVIVAGVCLAAPFCEELFFRGVFQARLTTALGAARGIFLSAFVFSFFHLDATKKIKAGNRGEGGRRERGRRWVLRGIVSRECGRRSLFGAALVQIQHACRRPETRAG